MLLYFWNRELLLIELTDKIVATETAPDGERRRFSGLPKNCRIDPVLSCCNDDVIDNAAQDFFSLLIRERRVMPQGRYLARKSAKLLQLLL